VSRAKCPAALGSWKSIGEKNASESKISRSFSTHVTLHTHTHTHTSARRTVVGTEYENIILTIIIIIIRRKSTSAYELTD